MKSLGERIRDNRIRAVWSTSRWRVWLWIVSGVLLVFAIALTVIQPQSAWTDYAAEAAGLAVTILVVDLIIAKHSDDRERRDLIHQMGSPDNTFATEAVRKLRARGWLTDATLARADLSQANLHEANLRRANLRRANLSGAALGGADLSEANLRGAILSKADLTGATLSRADLSEATLRETTLIGADLYWANLNKADLRWANLTRAKLIGTILVGAYLYWVDLIGAEMIGAEMKGANLSGADLSEANLRGAKLSDEQLDQAKALENATLPDGTRYSPQKLELEPTPVVTESDQFEEQPPGSELWDARENAGLSRKELAELVGMSAATVGRWERGEAVPRSAEVRRKVAEALGDDPWSRLEQG